MKNKYLLNTWTCPKCKKECFLVEKEGFAPDNWFGMKKNNHDMLDAVYCKEHHGSGFGVNEVEVICPRGSIFVWGEVDVD